MPIIINGTTIPTTEGSIKVNGTNITKVVCNGTTIWEVPQTLTAFTASFEQTYNCYFSRTAVSVNNTTYIASNDVNNGQTPRNSEGSYSATKDIMTFTSNIKNFTYAKVKLWACIYSNYGDGTLEYSTNGGSTWTTLVTFAYASQSGTIYQPELTLATSSLSSIKARVNLYNRSSNQYYFVDGGIGVQSVVLTNTA